MPSEPQANRSVRATDQADPSGKRMSTVMVAPVTIGPARSIRAYEFDHPRVLRLMAVPAPTANDR